MVLSPAYNKVNWPHSRPWTAESTPNAMSAWRQAWQSKVLPGALSTEGSRACIRADTVHTSPPAHLTSCYYSHLLLIFPRNPPLPQFLTLLTCSSHNSDKMGIARFTALPLPLLRVAAQLVGGVGFTPSLEAPGWG